MEEESEMESTEVMECEEPETEENAEEQPPKRKVYLPGQSLEEDEVLEHDPSAYIMLHEGDAGKYMP